MNPNDDDELKRALRVPDAADDVLTVRGLLGETFRHRHRLIVMVGLAKICAAAVLMFVAAWRMFAADDDRGRLLWGIAFLFGSIGVSSLATVHWLLLSRNAVTRGLKRLEVQIAELARRAGS
jgi:hypothetical protein